MLFIVTTTFAQSRRDVWRMGYRQAGPAFTMNFHTGTLQIDSILTPSPISMYIEDAAICDTSGNLLFYSNGISIANAQHNIMLNGDNLNPSPATSMWADYGMPSILGGIALPDPGNPNEYYLFYLSVRMGDLAGDTLFMAKIDMTLDGGLGGVIVKDYVVSNSGFMCGQLSACKHGNGRDWWLTLHGFNNDKYYKWLITPSGISSPSFQHIGLVKSYPIQGVFSPNGEKYGSYDNNYELELMDFDRCTGMFSNYINVYIPDNTVSNGCSFSPNSNLFYFSARNYLFQVDVTSSNVASTVDTVAIWDGFLDPISTQFVYQQLAPDNKIYITGFGSVQHLTVINYPDSLGTACNVAQHSIVLPGKNNGSMPNYPFYELGAMGGTICDSLSTDLTELVFNSTTFQVFPNPATEYIYITNDLYNKIRSIEIYNLQGQKIISKEISNYEQFNLIDLNEISTGFFEVLIFTEKDVFRKKFVKNTH